MMNVLASLDVGTLFIYNTTLSYSSSKTIHVETIVGRSNIHWASRGIECGCNDVTIETYCILAYPPYDVRLLESPVLVTATGSSHGIDLAQYTTTRSFTAGNTTSYAFHETNIETPTITIMGDGGLLCVANSGNVESVTFDNYGKP